MVLFEVPATPASVAAFTEREHEFRFVAVQPLSPTGEKERLAVSYYSKQQATKGKAEQS